MHTLLLCCSSSFFSLVSLIAKITSKATDKANAWDKSRSRCPPALWPCHGICRDGKGRSAPHGLDLTRNPLEPASNKNVDRRGKGEEAEQSNGEEKWYFAASSIQADCAELC